MGDGVLVYFGYPQAHEDDAERAVRAALSLIGAVASIRRDVAAALQIRIGIATGTVVVTELLIEKLQRSRPSLVRRRTSSRAFKRWLSQGLC